jgi:hypothetical protein
LEHRPWWRWALVAAAVWIALLHSTLWWLDGHPEPRTLWGDENTYRQSALELLAGDPGWWPEALWPPLYPQFLAGLIAVDGGSLVAVILVQCALLVLTALLLCDLVRRITASSAAGTAVALATLSYPPLAAFAHYLWPEVLHLFLFTVVLWILAARIERPAWCAVAGVALGLSLLAKSLLLPFVPVLLAAAVWGRPLRRSAAIAALLLGSAAVTMAPTLMAGSHRTGSPPIGNSATFNLWVGLNDVGRESFTNDVVWPEYQRWVASAETPAERDRVLRSRIRDLVRERGFFAVLTDQLTKQPFRLFDLSSYFSDQLPGGGAQTQAGAGYLGLGAGAGRVLGWIAGLGVLLLYAASSSGWVIGGCAGDRWARTLALFILYNLALFLWLHVKTRYRIQMLPSAMIGVGCLVAWFEAGCRPRPSAAGVVAATAAIGLLAWFALA